MHNHIEEINRIYELNKKLLRVLKEIGFDLIHFADKYNYPLPPNLKDNLDETEKLITELNYPMSINKKCNICEKLNSDNADYCCYCGSSMVITRMRHQDKSPEDVAEPCFNRFIYQGIYE